MAEYRVRTDLALEAKESVEEKNEQIRGVNVEEYYEPDSEIHITKVIVETKNGAKEIGKPMGTYITLEAPNMAEPDEGYHQEISEELAKHMRTLLPDMKEEKSVLIVGLGNRDVTPDALGPNVVNNMMITRHIIREYGAAAYGSEKVNLISSITPGVMAQTGMEASEIVKGIINETNPDLIIAIDALAARSTKRLNRTIQVTDTGIHPGSGVGNHRSAITEEVLGVPVIAIGVPLVVDAGTIVNDAIAAILQEIAVLSGSSPEHVESLRGTMTELGNFYVTPKDIDETVKRLGFTISEALNMALE